jgi:hypothetical protein
MAKLSLAIVGYSSQVLLKHGVKASKSPVRKRGLMFGYRVSAPIGQFGAVELCLDSARWWQEGPRVVQAGCKRRAI